MLWCYIFLQLHFTSRSPSAFTVGLETPKLRAELVPVPGDQTSLKDQKVKQTLEERRHFCETLGFCATSRSWRFLIKSVQFSSVAQSCLTLWDPMACSTPGFPVHHQLPELTQTHIHQVGDAIQPSHPLSSPSPPAYNPSQHQGLFKWNSSSHQLAKKLSSESERAQYLGLSDKPIISEEWG